MSKKLMHWVMIATSILLVECANIKGYWHASENKSLPIQVKTVAILEHLRPDVISHAADMTSLDIFQGKALPLSASPQENEISNALNQVEESISQSEFEIQYATESQEPPCIQTLNELMAFTPKRKVAAWRHVQFEDLSYEHFKVRREFKKWFSCHVQRTIHAGIAKGEQYYFDLVENVAQEYYPAFIQARQEELPIIRALQAEMVLESMLDVNAVSKAGAAGPWQFMRPTFKTLLKRWDVEDAYPLVDDRFSWHLSSRAAMELTQENMRQFANTKSPLVCTMMAYNAGPGRLKEAMRRQGRNDCRRLKYSQYWHPSYVRYETYRYTARIKLILLLMEWRKANGYAHASRLAPPVEYVHGHGTIKLKDLARRIGVSASELQQLNMRFPLGITKEVSGLPQLYASVITAPQMNFHKNNPLSNYDDLQMADFQTQIFSNDWVLIVPQGTKDRVEATLSTMRRLSNRQIERYIKKQAPRNWDIELGVNHFRYYRVRKGDTVSHICKQFHIEQEKLLQLNERLLHRNEKRSGKQWTLYPNQRLRIPAIRHLVNNT